MRGVALLGLGLALTLSASVRSEVADWRVDLLEEEGVGLSEEALRAALDGYRKSPVALEAAYRQLGSDRFPEREKAQAELIKGGNATLEWLEGIEDSPDPEVRGRVHEIRRDLTFSLVAGGGALLRHAMSSLLEDLPERGGSTGGMFHEWFGEPFVKLKEDYRQFGFETDAGRWGKVDEGRMMLSGEGGKDGDQSLVLRSQQWPGEKEIGESFTVSVRLGGTEGGSGGWHLGIAIGKVRVLYHPGHRGGGFRFEQTEQSDYLLMNQDMGFTPSAESLQRMSVRVDRLADGRVRLDALVAQGENGQVQFERAITVDSEVIGPLDRVSLDRSGRSGGTAIFDDFVVILEPR